MMVGYTTKNDKKVSSYLNYDIMTFDTLYYILWIVDVLRDR